MSAERNEHRYHTSQELLTGGGVEGVIKSGRYIRVLSVKDEDLYLLELTPKFINPESAVLVRDNEMPELLMFVRPEDGQTIAFPDRVPFTAEEYKTLEPRMRSALIDKLINENSSSEELF